MKKSVAAVLAVFMMLSGLAACGKSTPKKEQVTGKEQVTETTVKETVPLVTDFAGMEYYAVTDSDGSAVRDGEGNMVVYATDANGAAIEDKTEARPLENAVVIGNRIETAEFSIGIPEGWSDARSYSMVNIGNDETLDMITVEVSDEVTLDEKRQEISDFIASVSKAQESAVLKSEEITVCGEKAFFESCYVKLENDEVYMGDIVFAHGTDVYICRIMAERLPSEEEIDEMIDILNSIEFVR